MRRTLKTTSFGRTKALAKTSREDCSTGRLILSDGITTNEIVVANTYRKNNVEVDREQELINITFADGQMWFGDFAKLQAALKPVKDLAPTAPTAPTAPAPTGEVYLLASQRDCLYNEIIDCLKSSYNERGEFGAQPEHKHLATQVIVTWCGSTNVRVNNEAPQGPKGGRIERLTLDQYNMLHQCIYNTLMNCTYDDQGNRLTHGDHNNVYEAATDVIKEWCTTTKILLPYAH